MLRILTTCFLILCAPSLVVAQATQKPIRLATFPIPLMVESETKGLFIELTRSLAKRANIAVSIEVNPAKRSLSRFMQGQVDGLFPALDVNFPPNYAFVRSEEMIYSKNDYAFTFHKQPLIKQLSELEGKRVGITRGYPYVKAITQNPSITLDIAGTDELGMQKLAAGRVDAFIVEEESGLAALRHTQLREQVHYSALHPISQQDVYYAFQDSEEGRRLSKLLSSALKQMIRDGSFQALFPSR